MEGLKHDVFVFPAFWDMWQVERKEKRNTYSTKELSQVDCIFLLEIVKTNKNVRKFRIKTKDI